MSKITRRDFLISSLKLCGCCAAAYGALGPKLVFAQSPQGTGKILVLINFFGGIDGLNWIIPYNNQIYYDRRPTIAIPQSSVLPLTNEVGLHPAWSLLHQSVFNENNAAIIQQVGYPNANHSHFESQDIWSLGRRADNNTDGRGWIGRLSDLYFDSNYDVIGMGVSQRIDFQANNSVSRPLVVNSLRDFGFENDWQSWNDNPFRSQTAEINAFTNPSQQNLQNKVQQSFRAIYASQEQLRQIDADYSSTIQYPGNSLGTSLQEIAKVIQSGIGTQLFYTGIGGWDTHSGEINTINQNLLGVSQAVSAFIQDLKLMGKWNQVCVAFFSEFGRNCFENGTGGTDHGHGNPMVVMGGDVKGGVYGPTPSAQDLSQDDVGYYIDYRSVFKKIIRSHFDLDPNPVFDEPVPIAEPDLPIFV